MQEVGTDKRPKCLTVTALLRQTCLHTAVAQGGEPTFAARLTKGRIRPGERSFMAVCENLPLWRPTLANRLYSNEIEDGT